MTTPFFPVLDLPPKPRRIRRLPAHPRFRVEEYKVVALRETYIKDVHGGTPNEINRFYHEVIIDDPRHNPEVECLYAIVLNVRRQIRGFHLVATGTQDSCFSHSREVFRAAIIASAASIVLLHNHPSGDPSPSDADVRVTRELIRAGQVLRINVLDHVIVTHTEKFVSLREIGHFC